MKIGLIGAMKEEIELIRQAMEGGKETRAAGISFYEGKWNGQDIVLCKCGVGKVNAAMCTQILIDRYGIDTVIFTGVAGALHPELNIGDLVISTECIQHDMDASALGFAKGVVPFEPISVYGADPTLVDTAYKVGMEIFDVNVMKGRVLSGDQFIADRELVVKLRSELDGVCAEMEGAAVAQVCHMNGIPYVVIRSMSDRADGSALVNFAEFTELASTNSYLLVDALLKRLPVI